MKQQFIVNTADTFKTCIYENNRVIMPGSALITVWGPGGNKLIDNAVMSVGSDGLLSFNLSQVDNEYAGLNYRAVIAYAYNDSVSYATLFYDVVNSKLLKVVTDEDVVSELPQLRDNGWRERGVAEGGSASSITDSGLKRYGDDYFTGGLAYSVDKDETREIKGFASATGTVITGDFSAAVAAGEKYVLTRSFSKEIQRAFEKMTERLERMGKRPHLVLDPYDLR